MDPEEQPAGAPDPPRAPAPPDYQAAIDDTLQTLYSQYARLGSRLTPGTPPRLRLEQLRQGPLADVLSHLAQIATGAMPAAPDEVLGAVDWVVQLLFWPPGADSYTVPRSFWEERPLGRMLAQAKFRAFGMDELLGIGRAAEALGVTRATIYRWIAERRLDSVRDDLGGRTFVVRADVEALRDAPPE